MKANIDLLREESRFFIPVSALEGFLKEIKKKFYRKRFSHNEVVQTLYLGNDEQTVPWGMSLKVRRYLKDYSLEMFLDPNEKYLFEFKQKISGTSLNAREKTPRQETSISEAVKIASQQLGVSLRPYLLVEYYRQHFLPKINIPLRLTVDTDVSYWYFGHDKPYFLKADREIVRVECKISTDIEKEPLVKSVFNFLSEIGAQPIISKKEEGFNLIKTHFDRYYARPLIKELKDCEIEAKFVLQNTDPIQFFIGLKEWCRQETLPIILDSHYPFTFTTSSINQYWCKKTDKELPREMVKFLFKGDVVRPVFKKRTIIIDSSLAIIKRKEVKEEKFFYSAEGFKGKLDSYSDRFGPLEYAGYLARSRKAIWPEHIASGRVYHVSLDRCLAPGKFPFYQLEIEYSGRHQNKCSEVIHQSLVEREIIEDTKYLARTILSVAKQKKINLQPNRLSKFDWLTN